MQVFNASLKIMWKNKVGILVYVVIFLFLAVFLSEVNGGTDGGYTDVSLALCVIDRDDTTLSKALRDYVAEGNKLVELPDDEGRLRDELFYRNVEYVLYIPEGFGDDVEAGRNPTLPNVKVPGSFTGVMLDGVVDEYVRTLQIYFAGGYTAEECVEKTRENLSTDTGVELLSGEGLVGEQPSFAYYYDFLNYILTACGILVIGLVLMPFFRKEMRMRNQSSAMKFSQMNIQMALACLVAAMGVYVALSVAGGVMYGGEQGLWDVYPYYFLNGLCVVLVAIGLGFCGGMLAKNSSILSGVCNVFSLGFAFLGGVFVPQELMSEGVLNFSRFVPAYWYVRVNEWILGIQGGNEGNMVQIWRGMAIQCGFAVAIFAVGLVIAKKRMGRV